jgi:Fe-S-cluster-containing dehydrogenase component/CRP-like cAMP-binding protein
MISFVIKKRGLVLEKKDFSSATITIGRRPSADIHFNYPLVSREHADIVRDGTGYLLVDSSNQGTKINGQLFKDQSKQLNQGDVIEIAPYTLDVVVLNTGEVALEEETSEGAKGQTIFSERMSENDIDNVLGINQEFNPNNLLHIALKEARSKNKEEQLREILLQDAKLVSFKEGEMIIREGDYANTAFALLKGRARVVLQKLPDKILKISTGEKKSVFSALSQLWKNSKESEARVSKTDHAQETASGSDAHKVFLQDVSAIIGEHKYAILDEGEVFGEVSALSRSPRGATIFAEDEAVLLEMNWQALREIRRITPSFKDKIDQNYRERCLKTHLVSTDIFKDLSDEIIDEITAKAQFFSFGNFEWHNEYKKITKESSEDRIKKEAVIVEEGTYVNGLYLIRSGFARVSRIENNGHYTMKYLGKGSVFGFDELIQNFNSETKISYKRSLRSIGYTEVIYVPSFLINKYILQDGSYTSKEEKAQVSNDKTPAKLEIDQGMMEFLVENRIMNGTKTMFIDLDRCTRCDDCVTACAQGHDNNPRFIRHGKQYAHFMVANACMHCNDPVCMIGCPTGAISRNHLEGQVVINDDTCVGCSTCANSCPYENIRMVSAKDEQGKVLVDDRTMRAVQKATKCDLCADQLGGPACVRACPHDAMERVDMSDVKKLKKFLNR